MNQQDIVQHNYQLIDIVLINLRVEKYADEIPDNPVGLTFHSEGDGKRINDKEGYSYLKIKLSFCEPNPKLFELELTLRGKCVPVNTDSNIEEFDLFLNQYALPLLWPFAREIVWNMVVRMNFPPLMLPSINVTRTIQASLKPENV